MEPTPSPCPSPVDPELLAPAGSLEKCRIAFLYGADAVYAAGKEYSLRAHARNFSREELAAGTVLARSLGKRFYVAVNTFASETDLDRLPAYLAYLAEIDVHGLIVADPGVVALSRRFAPDIPLHLSTQANTTNSASIAFWRDCGFRRVNLARELSFEEIQTIRGRSALELEMFVHGAMCVSYSGRCLLSAALNRRSANRGLCTQPCRWSYGLVEEKRPGQFFPLEEDSKGSYIFNSKDLCLIEELERLTALGIDAFKIEGRMKGALYLATTVRAYKQAMAPTDAPIRFWRKELDRVSHRPYTKGLLLPEESDAGHAVETDVAYMQTHTLAGIIRPAPEILLDSRSKQPSGMATMEVRSRIPQGSVLEFLFPDGTNRLHTVTHMETFLGNRVDAANPNAWIRIPVPFETFSCQVVRIRRPQNARS